MSKNVSVIVTDDLDGSEHAETVSFGFEGVTYEIDLAKKNRAKLEKALAPYIEAGRRVPRARAVHRPIAAPCGPGPGKPACRSPSAAGLAPTSCANTRRLTNCSARLAQAPGFASRARAGKTRCHGIEP
jgi:Lsr2